MEVAERVLQDPRIKKVVLIREDRLAVAVSKLRAASTGEFLCLTLFLSFRAMEVLHNHLKLISLSFWQHASVYWHLTVRQNLHQVPEIDKGYVIRFHIVNILESHADSMRLHSGCSMDAARCRIPHACVQVLSQWSLWRRCRWH